MRKKVLKISLIIAFVLFFCMATICILCIPFNEITSLPDKINIDYNSLTNITSTNPFGKFISCELSGNSMVQSNAPLEDLKLNIKLFNIITLKQIEVDTETIKVHTGGNTVGFSLNTSGVVVIGSSAVMTEKGSVDTLKNLDIKNGDIIVELAGEKVERLADLSEILDKEENRGKELSIKIRRDKKEIEYKITPAKDIYTQKYKLGLWVKDDASGVGTLTFVRTDNNRFGALGHAICDADTKKPIEINGGEMFNATIIGINKGAKGKPGELKALFIQGNNSIGEVDKNTKFGIFGKYNEDKLKDLNKNTIMQTGGRFTTKPGKAKIRVSLDNDTFKDYDIEIIKTNYQANCSDKSMVIRVVDKELLEKTGGIIQGMSGSPIIQNDKVVGAVTHVFVSDPTKGFGVYLDWMIEQ